MDAEVNSPPTVTPFGPNIAGPLTEGTEVQCESSICRDCRGDCNGCDKCPLCKLIQTTCDKGEKKLKLGYDMILIKDLYIEYGAFYIMELLCMQGLLILII